MEASSHEKLEINGKTLQRKPVKRVCIDLEEEESSVPSGVLPGSHHRRLTSRLRHLSFSFLTSLSSGISRLQRWERAELHGLSPPQEVRELLLKAPADSDLWSEYPL
uniref:Uncharacterized protein n=1 Tax=Oryzias melastigma TaxID=30732 RepID=A0A3B3DGQ5_ORYME